MELSITNDILVGADIIESPNQNARPDNTDIELLVIHNISLPPGEFGSLAIRQFFCNELDCNVSSLLWGDSRPSGVGSSLDRSRGSDYPVRALQQSSLACG